MCNNSARGQVTASAGEHNTVSQVRGIRAQRLQHWHHSASSRLRRLHNVSLQQASTDLHQHRASHARHAVRPPAAAAVRLPRHMLMLCRFTSRHLGPLVSVADLSDRRTDITLCWPPIVCCVMPHARLSPVGSRTPCLDSRHGVLDTSGLEHSAGADNDVSVTLNLLPTSQNLNLHKIIPRHHRPHR